MPRFRRNGRSNKSRILYNPKTGDYYAEAIDNTPPSAPTPVVIPITTQKIDLVVPENKNVIPKVAFFYWGGDFLPYLNFLTLKSFKKFNPDWDVILFRPTMIYDHKTWATPEHKIGYAGINYIDQLSSLDITIQEFDMASVGISNQIPEILKSDIIRWFLLSKYGGLWSDMDIIYLKPIDDIVVRNANDEIITDFDIIIQYNSQHRYYPIGFFMSKPDVNFFNNLHKHANKFLNVNDYQCVGSTLVGSLHPSIQTIDNVGLTRFSDLYPFLPVPSELSKLFYQDTILDDSVFGIHWYNGAEMSRQYINNGIYYDNFLMGKLIKLIDD